MNNQPMGQATLGGGCFWCLEAVYLDLVGVTNVVSGYAGGHVENPTYQEVCLETTGHAEVVQIEFDPAVLSYREILEVFFTIHDPTTYHRQGADVGSQYRSVVFYHDSEQERIAREMLLTLSASGKWSSPLVTEVLPLPRFFPAEEYHQRYFERHPFQPYCLMVVRPKVGAFRSRFPDRVRKD